MTATVTDIDAAKRKVTLVTSDGEKTTVKCGPEVINFDQIRVGDQLKATVTEELAVAMAAEGAPPSDGGAAVVALAPKGAKPGGIVANTVQVTAKVTAIDLKHHKATLQFPDGTSKTVAVRPDVDLTQRKVGEEVVIRTTEAVALSVQKP
jgi:phage baseplate assembly protein gpV